MGAHQEARWLRTYGQAGRLAHLVCMPHAGAGASAFAAWQALLPDTVTMHAVTLPGREARVAEAPILDIGLAADRIGAELLRRADLSRTVLFGHSFGGLLAHALATRLELCGRPPAHVIVSGCQPSDEPIPRRRIAHLDDDAFVEEIVSYGALPAKLAATAMMRVFLPALRADIRMAEEYMPARDRPLTAPLSAFGADRDLLAPLSAVREWRNYTRASFDVVPFSGTHFYLHGRSREVVGAILTRIRGVTHDP